MKRALLCLLLVAMPAPALSVVQGVATPRPCSVLTGRPLRSADRWFAFGKLSLLGGGHLPPATAERLAALGKLSAGQEATETVHAWQQELLASERPDPLACVCAAVVPGLWFAHECDREPELLLAQLGRYLTAGGTVPELQPALARLSAWHPKALAALSDLLFRDRATDGSREAYALLSDPEGAAEELLRGPHAAQMAPLARRALHRAEELPEMFVRRGLRHWQYEFGHALPPAVRRTMEMLAARRGGAAPDTSEVLKLADKLPPELQGVLPRCLLALDPACSPWRPLDDAEASLFLMPDVSAVRLPQWSDALFGKTDQPEKGLWASVKSWFGAAPEPVEEDVAALRRLTEGARLGAVTAFALKEAEMVLPEGYRRALMGVEGYDSFTSYIRVELLRDGIDIVNTPQGPRFSMDDEGLRREARALQLALHRVVLRMACLERDGRTEALQQAARALAGVLNEKNLWPMLINQYELRGVSSAALHALLTHFRGAAQLQRALAVTLLGERQMRALVAVQAETQLAAPLFLKLLDPAVSAAEKEKLRAHVRREFAEEIGCAEQLPELPEGAAPELQWWFGALLAQHEPAAWLRLVQMAPATTVERLNLLCGDAMPAEARRALMEKLASEGKTTAAAYLAEEWLYRACICSTPGRETGSHADIVRLRQQADAWWQATPKEQPTAAREPESPYPPVELGDYEWHLEGQDGRIHVFRAGIAELGSSMPMRDARREPLLLRKSDGQEVQVRLGQLDEEDVAHVQDWMERNHIRPIPHLNYVVNGVPMVYMARPLERIFFCHSLSSVVSFGLRQRQEALRLRTAAGKLFTLRQTETEPEVWAAIAAELPPPEGADELRTFENWGAARRFASVHDRAAVAVLLGARGGATEQAWQRMTQDESVRAAMNQNGAPVLCYADAEGQWDANALAAAAEVGQPAREGYMLELRRGMRAAGCFFRAPDATETDKLRSAFMKALHEKRFDEAAAMLEGHPELAQARGLNGESALWVALYAENAEMVKRLLEAGADPLACSGQGSMRMPPPLYEAIRRSRAMTELMLAHGADLRRMEALGWPACAAVENAGPTRKPEENRAMLELVLSHGASIDAEDADGKTALALAVRDGRVPMLRLLMRCGADSSRLTLRENNVDIPIALSCLEDTPPASVRMALIEEGYDPATASPLTPETLLSYAVRRGDKKMARALLERGVSPETRYKDEPMLAYCGRLTGGEEQAKRSPEEQAKVLQQQMEMAELLIEFGADINARASAHRSLLGLADCYYYNEQGEKRLVAAREWVAFLRQLGAVMLEEEIPNHS